MIHNEKEKKKNRSKEEEKKKPLSILTWEIIANIAVLGCLGSYKGNICL